MRLIIDLCWISLNLYLWLDIFVYTRIEISTYPLRMNALDYLRDEIKNYFPDSRELQLSEAFDGQRRFNFYFEIAPGQKYLLYLNWDGDIDGFTLKCLEFPNESVLQELSAAYTEKGSKMFNIGQPIATLSFLCEREDQLRVRDYKGKRHLDSREISARSLMYAVNPFE